MPTNHLTDWPPRDEPPDLTLPWCTYITRHPTGFWYGGKGITQNVANGTYLGSGIRLQLAFHHPDTPRETWTATVLRTFANEEDAYRAEGQLVTYDSLCDPFCVNMKIGGRVRKHAGTHQAALKRTECRMKEAERAKKAAAALAKKEEKVKKQEAVRARIAANKLKNEMEAADILLRKREEAARRAAGLVGRPNKPEANAKLSARKAISAATKASMSDPDERARRAAAYPKTLPTRVFLTCEHCGKEGKKGPMTRHIPVCKAKKELNRG